MTLTGSPVRATTPPPQDSMDPLVGDVHSGEGKLTTGQTVVDNSGRESPVPPLPLTDAESPPRASFGNELASRGKPITACQVLTIVGLAGLVTAVALEMFGTADVSGTASDAYSEYAEPFVNSTLNGLNNSLTGLGLI